MAPSAYAPVGLDITAKVYLGIINIFLNKKEVKMFYLIVAGSRTFNDYEILSNKLDALLVNQTEVTIVSGGAKGADTLAEHYAKQHNYPLKVFNADWNTYGKSAGYRRNEQMHKFISQFENRGCVCFWDGSSKGTQHNFKLAEQFKTPLRICKFNLLPPVNEGGEPEIELA